MNIPLRGKVYELTEDYITIAYIIPKGCRFKIRSIRVTTQNDYIKFAFAAAINKNSPLKKENRGHICTISTEKFDELKFVEVENGK